MDKVRKKKQVKYSVNLKFFYIRTSKPKTFVNKLEQLCRKYSEKEDFFFNYSVDG